MDMDALNARVERLELHNRRLKIVAAVALLTFGLLGAAESQEVPQDVVARSFRVVDADGDVRAMMTARGLGYFDDNGTMRTQMTHLGFAHSDADDTLRLEILDDHIRYSDESGAPRVLISSEGIRYLDRDGEVAWQVTQ